MPEKNYYKEIEDAFRKKREAAEALRQIRLNEVHGASEEIRLLDLRLSQTGSRILSALQSGADAKEKVDEIRAENDAIRKKREKLMTQIGFPADYTGVKYDCERCADSGYVGIDMCDCMKNAIAEARLSDSELGRLAATQSFDDFDLSYYAPGEEREAMKRNVQLIRAFAEGFTSKSEQSWLLMGGTGHGKTHISTALGVTVIKRGYSVEYKTVQSVMDDYQQVQFRGGDTSNIDKYYDCDLLIVDDLGAEMSTQFTVSCIYNLVNTRMNRRKPTVFSTNLTPSEIRERYNDRITSRLFGEFIPLQFKGTDIRRQRLARKGGRI